MSQHMFVIPSLGEGFVDALDERLISDMRVYFLLEALFEEPPLFVGGLSGGPRVRQLLSVASRMNPDTPRAFLSTTFEKVSEGFVKEERVEIGGADFYNALTSSRRGAVDTGSRVFFRSGESEFTVETFHDVSVMRVVTDDVTVVGRVLPEVAYEEVDLTVVEEPRLLAVIGERTSDIGMNVQTIR